MEDVGLSVTVREPGIASVRFRPKGLKQTLQLVIWILTGSTVVVPYIKRSEGPNVER